MNARYSLVQKPWVLGLIRQWEELGGRAVIVSDIGLLLALRDAGFGLDLHLSAITGVYNPASVHFFANLGVTRVVLPRDLAIEEIRTLVADSSPMRFEVLVINQRCQFMDGLCAFYHGIRLPSDVPTLFDYEFENESPQAAAWSYDPGYEGHGCQLFWQSDRGPVRLARQYDDSTPPCAACFLHQFQCIGVNYFKIAGRSYPVKSIVRAVRFLRSALDISSAGWNCDEIRRLYATTFGKPCDGTSCYYRWNTPVG